MASLLGTPAAYNMACGTELLAFIGRNMDWTYLSTREVVTCGECGRPSIQRRCAILLLCAFREVREAEEAWLLRLTLLLEISGIHCDS